MEYNRFLMFGDSITQFAFDSRMGNEDGPHEFTIGAALSNAYARKLEIMSRGFSGYNSRWALQLLPKILEAENNIKIAVVFFGTNDEAKGNNQEVPKQEYKQNMASLIKMLQNNDIKTILIGPAHFSQELWDLRGNESAVGKRSSEGLKEYSDILETLAEEYNTGFVNLHQAFITASGEEGPSALLQDGIHFNGRGYEVFYNELMSVIEKKFPEFLPENLPRICKDWKDIEADSCEVFP